jgi:hypothetical protein
MKFREATVLVRKSGMWDTAGLPLKPLAGLTALLGWPQLRSGALLSHQRCPDFRLRSTSHDSVCGFLSKKAA